MKGNKIIYMLVAIVIAIGLFYGGLKYGEAHAAPGAGAAAGQFSRSGAAGAYGGFAGARTGTGRGGAAGGGASVAAGQVLSNDGQSITVSLQGGGSKIVFVSASTSVMKTTLGGLNDLQSGTNVNVIGSTNSDGSVTASSIQIRPAGSFPQQSAISTQ